MQEKEQEFSFKSLFIPLTTLKAIHLIIIVGFIVFGNVLFNGFVWDDLPFIVDNPQVHTLNFVNLFGANLFNSGSFYRPIPAVYFASLYFLFGTNAFFYHVFQIILHIVSTSLVFIFFQKFFNKYLAFFLSLVFLIHPINVESVAYIGATQSELFFIPGMTALLLANEKTIYMKRYILISIFLLLSIFSKETGFLFVVILIFYRYLITNKIAKGLILGGTVISIGYFFVRLLVGKVTLGNSPYIPIAELTFVERLLSIPAIIVYYLQTIIYPAKLAIWQDWTITSFTDKRFIFSLLICIVIAIVALWSGDVL